jgi:hypothetical protein
MFSSTLLIDKSVLDGSWVKLKCESSAKPCKHWYLIQTFKDRSLLVLKQSLALLAMTQLLLLIQLLQLALTKQLSKQATLLMAAWVTTH